MRRMWCTLVVVAALVLSTGPAGAQEATVEEVDVAALVSLFPDDGGTCTGVPDAIPGIFDFTGACAAHDVCYASGEDQAVCDEEFRQDTVSACVAQHPSAVSAGRYACLFFAHLYYAGVRFFGEFFI